MVGLGSRSSSDSKLGFTAMRNTAIEEVLSSPCPGNGAPKIVLPARPRHTPTQPMASHRAIEVTRLALVFGCFICIDLPLLVVVDVAPAPRAHRRERHEPSWRRSACLVGKRIWNRRCCRALFVESVPSLRSILVGAQSLAASMQPAQYFVSYLAIASRYWVVFSPRVWDKWIWNRDQPTPSAQ